MYRVGPLSVQRASAAVFTPTQVLDAPVFAASRTPAGQWSIVAPCCRDLSGRTGVRRIAALDEPAADGAEVIKLQERRRT